MSARSNGNSFGSSTHNGPDTPKLWRNRAVADARAVSVTFWDLL